MSNHTAEISNRTAAENPRHRAARRAAANMKRERAAGIPANYTAENPVDLR